MRMLEGFSGSGRLAQTFRDGGWEADTVDIKDGQDIMTWEPTEHYDYVHLAPPCQEYSMLGAIHHPDNALGIWRADTTLWNRSLALIRQIRPTIWTIENVKGAQWVWGKAPYHYASFFFWGWFPFHLMPKVPWSYSFKGTHRDRINGRRWDEGRTASEKAAYPFSLCNAILDAANGEPRLKSPIEVPARRRRVVEPSAQRSAP